LVGLVRIQRLCDRDIIALAFGIPTDDTVTPSRSPGGATWIAVLTTEIIVVSIPGQQMVLYTKGGERTWLEFDSRKSRVRSEPELNKEAKGGRASRR
jgi:hypothetical protein